jgi:hypothetical protein
VIAGPPLGRGRTALDAIADEVWWRGISPLLCGACLEALPSFRFQPSLAAPVGASAGSRRVGFALRRDEETERWAARTGVRLVMPSASLVARVGDKLALAELAAEAGVRTPAAVSVVADPDRCAALWDERPGDELVAQLASDGLTGAGTMPVRCELDLARVLAAWQGRELKLAAMARGLPITVGGCVGPRRTLASGISHQLVGFAALGAGWGAHCGNQLLGEGELPAPLSAAALAACEALGEVLRRRGYRGMFGLDAIAGEAGVEVIEINPRIQGVTALAAAAELEAGLLPTPASHVLAHGEAPPAAVRTWPRRPLSQLFVGAGHAGRNSGGIDPGCYRLDPDGSLLRVAELPSPLGLERGEAAIWPFAGPGDAVAPGTRLAVLQFGERVAPVDPARELHPRAGRWVEAVRAAFAAPRPIAAGAR